MELSDAPSPVAERTGRPAGAARPSAPGLSILVVDDDPDYGALVRRTLRRQQLGCDVVHVQDGFACLEALDRQRFSVVLLDYGLPRMNGLEVLRRIHDLGLGVPVIMATGQGDERTAVEAMKAGAIDYVVKTAGYFDTLPMVLKKVLKQHELAFENTRLYREAQEQQMRLEQILDSTSDGIVLVDGAGTVMRVNRRACELLGFDPGVARGATLNELVGTGSGKEDGGAQAAPPFLGLLADSGGAREGDLALAGGRRILHWVGQRTCDAGGATVGFTATFRDVTREREISQMKSDFVSFVAHQLRTPLSGIKWMLELASDEPDVAPELASFVRDAASSADRLISMVNDLLDISRLENGGFTVSCEVTPLGELTRSVIEDLNSLIVEKGHRLSVTGGDTIPPITVDPQLLRQVVVNLVSNAVKYTPSGGEIAIRMFAMPGSVCWEIRDSGIGIPQEAQGRLFEKFYRADNALTVETDGTGLGLYLVRLITELFHGRLSWASEPGRGTTFVVTLPAVR